MSVCIHRTSVAVRVCPSAHTGRLWLSISSHISTLVLGLCTLALPVDCLGDFGPRGLSVQYTQDVCGCPPAHTGRPWRSVCARQHTQDVCGCPSAHTGRPCVSISTHMTFVAVRVCLCVSVSTHMTFVAVHQYTYQHVGPLTPHADPSCGLFGTSVGVRQHTQDVRGCLWLSVRTHRTSVCVRVCLSAHTEHPWVSISTHRTSVGVRQHTQDIRVGPCVSVSTHRTFVAVRVWTCVSVSTHMTSVAVHQYTYKHVGPRTPHADPSLHTGRPWVSASTHRTSVAVRVCPSLSVNTHMTSVAVTQYTYQHVGPWTQHAGPSHGLFGTSMGVRQHTQDVRGCLWLSVSTHRTSVCVCQHTQDVRGCRSAHTGRSCVSVSIHRTSVAVCVCPSAHTGRLWLSISTHISTLVLGLCTLALPVDCLGDFGPRGLSVQYTQDVRGCPPAHTGRPWRSVCVRQHTHDVRGCPSVYISARWSLDSTRWPFPWTVWGILAHDVCGCPSEHTGRSCVSVSTHRTFVAVRVCPCVSVSTHMTSVALHQYTYQHVCPLTPHADPSLHTGRAWVSASTHRTSVAVRVCPSVSVSTHRTSVAVPQYTNQHVGPWTQHTGPSRGLFG
ncbi:hypothetical protein IGI04_019949 [Brassica rapa subsp. trilocularis]|uniref:Uncharacterized protein n=1 Tax=Brassica rapa subsp. trilocularis TaxID=1813537 RepID=A0ABQ7MI93_BRACM|nr:hypothetical protein IGI04_019949 [Brassica rapa subsp. trilocularis]